jgi:hypothetical protein
MAPNPPGGPEEVTMACFEWRGWLRGVTAAAAVALGVLIGAAVPVSAEQPSPTPFTTAGDASPMELPPPHTGGRRPAPQDTSGNLLVHDGRVRSLPDAPGALITVHRGLDDRGRTVGTYVDEGAVLDPDGFFPPETIHGFVYEHRRFRTIDIPGVVAFPYDINDRGQIVGVSVDANVVPGPDGLLPAGAQHAFVWERGRVTSIDPPDTV